MYVYKEEKCVRASARYININETPSAEIKVAITATLTFSAV